VLTSKQSNLIKPTTAQTATKQTKEGEAFLEASKQSRPVSKKVSRLSNQDKLGCRVQPGASTIVFNPASQFALEHEDAPEFGATATLNKKLIRKVKKGGASGSNKGADFSTAFSSRMALASNQKTSLPASTNKVSRGGFGSSAAVSSKSMHSKTQQSGFSQAAFSASNPRGPVSGHPSGTAVSLKQSTLKNYSSS